MQMMSGGRVLIFAKSANDEWWQGTYICQKCYAEFMTDSDKKPSYCPMCGEKFEFMIERR